MFQLSLLFYSSSQQCWMLSSPLCDVITESARDPLTSPTLDQKVDKKKNKSEHKRHFRKILYFFLSHPHFSTFFCSTHMHLRLKIMLFTSVFDYQTFYCSELTGYFVKSDKICFISVARAEGGEAGGRPQQ